MVDKKFWAAVGVLCVFILLIGYFFHLRNTNIEPTPEEQKWEQVKAEVEKTEEKALEQIADNELNFLQAPPYKLGKGIETSDLTYLFNCSYQTMVLELSDLTQRVCVIDNKDVVIRSDMVLNQTWWNETLSGDTVKIVFTLTVYVEINAKAKTFEGVAHSDAIAYNYKNEELVSYTKDWDIEKQDIV